MLFECANYYSCDNLGMLSKSKGQVLRVAAAFHVLFYIKNTDATVSIENDCAQEADITSEGNVITDLWNFLLNKLNTVSYSIDSPEISDEISEKAVEAAINFVGLCTQQTAYMAGRMDIQEEIEIIKAGKWFYTPLTSTV